MRLDDLALEGAKTAYDRACESLLAIEGLYWRAERQSWAKNPEVVKFFVFEVAFAKHWLDIKRDELIRLQREQETTHG